MVNQKASALKADVAEIRRTLDLLLEPGQVAELRVIKTQQGTVSGYFTDFDNLAQQAAHYSGKAPGVYVTLNPVNPDLLARANNHVKKYAKETTADRDILKRRWFPIDFDAKRPAGISSTDAEHEAALARARECRTWLQSQDWPAPISTDSAITRNEIPAIRVGRRLLVPRAALDRMLSEANIEEDQTGGDEKTT